MTTFKPYDLVLLEVQTSTRPRMVEVISQPIGDGTINVRMVPGEPTTMETVSLDRLAPYPRKYRYVHVARVYCSFYFPEDMLRYDCAALFDHELPEEGETDRGLKVPEEGLVVYALSQIKRVAPWTTARWTSFGARVEPLYVCDLRSHEDKVIKV